MGTRNVTGDGNVNKITISKGSAPPRKLNTLTGVTDRSFAQPSPTSAVQPIEPKVHASVVDEEKAIRENTQKEKEQATQREIEVRRARTAQTRQEAAQAAEEATRKKVEGSRKKTTGELPEKTNDDSGDNYSSDN